MVTNTPVGVLRAVVILPSCLDFTVVHRLLRQTSTCRDHGRNELVTEDCAQITGHSGMIHLINRLLKNLVFEVFSFSVFSFC